MKNRYVLPRYVVGNRGDIASRWGVLNAFKQMGLAPPPVFTEFPDDLPENYPEIIAPGPLRNLFWTKEGRKTLKRANSIIWTPGLDLQDDSSSMRLLFHLLLFKRFKKHDLNIILLFQGAGPITTRFGKYLTKQIFNHVDLMVTRDPNSKDLIKDIAPNSNVIVGYDGIFLNGFEELVTEHQSEGIRVNSDKLQIGFNIRQWFHFNNSVLPYQLNRKAYQGRSPEKMRYLINSSISFITSLRNKHDAQVILISEYIEGIHPWEDDSPWLRIIKDHFSSDDNVILADPSANMYRFFNLMSSLDLMVGMRLHASLTALRYGVPAISISYTNKCRDIMNHLGLNDNVIDLEEFIKSPTALNERVDEILSDLTNDRLRTDKLIQKVISDNLRIFSTIFEEE